MARKIDRDKALSLRLKGYSYSQIKKEIGISKSTLSGWLSNYPLSSDRIKELRDWNPRRIENFINTMRNKREQKFLVALEKAQKDINFLSERDLFIGGFFLYWAEGGKTKMGSLSLGNTDPSMLKVFIKWLGLLGISKNNVKVKLHLYRDMNINREISFWQKELGVEKCQFIKPYIKDSLLSGLTYKSGFGHGTCNIVVDRTEPTRYVLMGVRYIVKVLTGTESVLRL
ncbi:MAG: helix-turn-helix domain-containing protein [bacterium]|nr:helix-turn-helix domain-containing protein [bacterium]